jgi:hypothetical protein
MLRFAMFQRSVKSAGARRFSIGLRGVGRPGFALREPFDHVTGPFQGITVGGQPAGRFAAAQRDLV